MGHQTLTFRHRLRYMYTSYTCSLQAAYVYILSQYNSIQSFGETQVLTPPLGKTALKTCSRRLHERGNASTHAHADYLHVRQNDQPVHIYEGHSATEDQERIVAQISWPLSCFPAQVFSNNTCRFISYADALTTVHLYI